jgi:ankyrin repeat protein
VTVGHETDIIQLVHFTLEEYFRNYEQLFHHGHGRLAQHFQGGHETITGICLTYLGLDFSESQEGFFWQYAADHWGDHARNGYPLSPEALARVSGFLLRNHEQSNRAVQDLLQRLGRPDGPDDSVTPQHISAALGLVQMFERIPLFTANANAQCVDGSTPIAWAAAEGQEAVVDMLVKSKLVELDVEEKDGMTPLWHATLNRHDRIVNYLLNTGKVNVNAFYQNECLLSWNAKNNLVGAVQALLAYDDIDVDCMDDHGRTPLSLGAESWSIEIVKALLEHPHTDLNTADIFGDTPLSYAVRRNNTEMVKLLLSHERLLVGPRTISRATTLGRNLVEASSDIRHLVREKVEGCDKELSVIRQ